MAAPEPMHLEYRHQVMNGRFVASICMSCGKVIGYATTARNRQIIEKAHVCALDPDAPGHHHA